MKEYIILNLNDSTKDTPIFWRADNAGYTMYPFAAGIYTEEQINAKPKYYNDGKNTIAICLNDRSLEKCGLKYKLNICELKKFIEENKFKG